MSNIDKALEEIKQRLSKENLPINNETIKIMATIILDEIEPLPSGKKRKII